MTQPRTYTPKHLAEKILRQKSALEGERKQVTVLFVDVKDSMRLAARVDAEAWHRILDRFFGLLADAIHRFEGTVNQYTGDGVMALFGAPIAHEDHAQRACHAALAIAEQVREFAAELRQATGLRFSVRVGLNSGEVVVGAIGDDLRMDYTAQGHTVGLAARMQQSATAGRIYLTGHTAALVAEYFELEPVGKVRVKGVREAVKTFALVGAGRARSRIQASRARGFSRFVGREPEVEALERALARAESGDGRVVGVLGSPGVGKSRLCHDSISRWRAQKIAVAEAHCPAHGRTLAFAVLRDLLRSFFAITPGQRPAASRKQVRAKLKRVRSATDEDHALVLHFLGLASPRDALPALAPDARRDRLFALACGLVQAQSAREPTVLFLDDVLIVGHVGDSRLYRVRDGAIDQVTEDHSLLNDYVRMKRLSSSEIAAFPHKNVIVRALGMKISIEVDILLEHPRLGDLYVICSDGLSGMVSDADIAALASEEADLDKLCELLIASANSNGGIDNITVVCARLEPL